MMKIVWVLPFLLACSAEAEPDPVWHGNRPASTSEMSELPDSDGGGWGVCDHVEYTLLDGRKIRMPALCDPNADQIWDPPPDKEHVDVAPVLPPVDVKSR